MRAIESLLPPGANATTTFTGRCGQLCAKAGAATAIAAADVRNCLRVCIACSRVSLDLTVASLSNIDARRAPRQSPGKLRPVGEPLAPRQHQRVLNAPAADKSQLLAADA